MASETSSLIKVQYTGKDDIASQMSGLLGTVISGVQVAAFLIIFLLFKYDTDAEDFTTEKYIIFRDIMVMLLLGFGYCKSKNMVDQLSNLLEYSNPPTSL